MTSQMPPGNMNETVLRAFVPTIPSGRMLYSLGIYTVVIFISQLKVGLLEGLQLKSLVVEDFPDHESSHAFYLVSS